MGSRSATQPRPPARGGLRGTERVRIDRASRGLLAWIGPLADRWGRKGRQDAAGLWVAAQEAPWLPLAVRVRAATSLDPFHR